MGMKKLLMPSLLLAGFSACSRGEPEPATLPTPPSVAAAKSELRPFKGLVESLEACSLTRQKYFLSELAKGLQPSWTAGFTREPVPHWGDLLKELVVQEKWLLLRHLLGDEALDSSHLSDIAETLGKCHDGPSFEILMRILEEPATNPGSLGTSNRRRPQALRGVVEFLSDSRYEPRAFAALTGLLMQDPDPIVRGFAATYLGDSHRPEAELALRNALGDLAPIDLDSNQSADVQDSVAERAKESLRRLPGRQPDLQ